MKAPGHLLIGLLGGAILGAAWFPFQPFTGWIMLTIGVGMILGAVVGLSWWTIERWREADHG